MGILYRKIYDSVKTHIMDYFIFITLVIIYGKNIMEHFYYFTK